MKSTRKSTKKSNKNSTEVDPPIVHVPDPPPPMTAPQIIPCPCHEWCQKGKCSQPRDYERMYLDMMEDYIPDQWQEIVFRKLKENNNSIQEMHELNAKYPNIKKDGATPHETSRHRNLTTDPRTVEQCWHLNTNFVYDRRHKDVYLELLGQIPPLVVKFLGKYKLDDYGNVISQTNHKNSLVGFDVDHKFPWSRGGRTKPHNLVCCQNVANRFIKKDNLIPCLKMKDMACGLQLNQLMGIVKYCLQRSEQKRGNLSNLLSTFERYLESDPPNNMRSNNDELSCSWFLFQQETRGCPDGEFLFSYFRYKENLQLYTMGLSNVNIVAPSVPSSEVPTVATVATVAPPPSEIPSSDPTSTVATVATVAPPTSDPTSTVANHVSPLEVPLSTVATVATVANPPVSPPSDTQKKPKTKKSLLTRIRSVFVSKKKGKEIVQVENEIDKLNVAIENIQLSDPLSVPNIFLSQNRDLERIEVSGYNQHLIGQRLHLEFDMAWDQERECWWKYVQYFSKDEIEEFSQGLKVYLESFGLSVVEEGDDEEVARIALMRFQEPIIPEVVNTEVRAAVNRFGRNRNQECKSCLKGIAKGKGKCWRHDPDRVRG